MQSSNTFIWISRPIPGVKKCALINDWENIAYCEKSEQSKALANKFGLFQIQLWNLEWVATPGKLCSFSNDLSLEAVFPVLKLTQNCYINMNIFFLKKGSLIINWVPFCATNILCLKKFPYNPTKHEMKGTSKIPISQLFSELGKFLKCSLGLNSENSIFYLFHELRKIGKSS